MKILALPLYPDTHPSSRFRLYVYLPHLHQAGLPDVTVIPAVDLERFQRDYLSPNFAGRFRYHWHEIQSRHRALRRAGEFDCIWVQKAFSLIYWRWWRKKFEKTGKPLIYDIDDAVFLCPPARAPFYLRWLEQRDQIDRLIQQARIVLAGNRLLVEYVQSVGGNPLLLPTPIDTERFHPAPLRERETVVIGWSGSHATHSCLNSIRKLWKPLADRHRKLEILVVSNEPTGIDLDAFAPIPARYEQWTREREAELIRQMDIGLMPLEQTEFQRYNCGLKALQYMASGLPVVCSPIGANQDIVVPGKSGYWARTDDEWVDVVPARRNAERTSSLFPCGIIAGRRMNSATSPRAV